MSASDAIAVVSFVAEYTVAPIVKQVKYVLDYKQNVTSLPKEVQKLMDLKQEVEGLVSCARRNAEDIKDSVGDWIKEADEIAEAALQKIQEEEEVSKKRCFIGLCPNPVSRHRSSRKAFKETEQVLQVQAAGRELKEGSVSFPVSAVPSLAVRVTLDKDFLDFSSRSKTWEEIMEALKDPDANVIGVYGMGGLGKTTLVKQVAARAAEEKLFDEVVVPTVTEKNVRDAKEFQEEMAKVLGMKLDDQWNVSQRAELIFKRLTQKPGDEKKTIVILDDLRAKLDLEQVGIPFRVGTKGCKILFTSRFQDISYAAQKNITIGVLEEEEAWTLFQKLAGDVLEVTAFFNIGKEVTKNCKGLPILIVAIAGALLSRRSLGAWNDALLKLQREESEQMQEFVDSALEFISFNHLPDANKSLFLLCGLLGGGEISIFDQLLKLGIGWGLFKHTKTVEEARNSLETLILDLKASFLLLDGQSVDTVRMHDVVRDVAIKIASKEGHNMLLGSSEEWPEDDVLRRCTALTFPYGIVPEPPQCLESQSLKFLLLYHNHSSLKTSKILFENMQELTVLDIRSVDFSPELPPSLAYLDKLHTLSLSFCKLRDISIVRALKKLKILDLNNTGIVVLPVEIGDLPELRVLDLNGCSELKVISPGVIQRLSRLEELHMAKSFSQWEVEGLAPSERRNASLDELNYLPKLTTLRIHIPDAKLLPKDLSFRKLERFTILVGDEEWDWACHDEQSLYRCRGIKIKVNGKMDIHLEVLLKEMLKKTEILYLDGMKNIHELEWKNFEELKFVHIQHSAETRYIVNAVESFPARSLESLFLSHLPQLQNLCRGMFTAESSFSKLKHVNVNSCNSLRSLFSFSMAKGLPRLEKLEVTDCDSLEEIVEDTKEDGKNGSTVVNKLEFNQLRYLTLERLPKMASFCNSNRQKLVTTDEISSEDGGTIIAPFFSEKVLFPKLEELIIKECDNMQYLFNQSIVTGLEQLNLMEIDNCKSLKEIVTHVEGEETNETIKFPRLVKLFLEDLPCLTRFCSGCSIVFPTLTVLWIFICERIKTFVWTDTVRQDKAMTNKTMQPLFNEKVELPNLKSLLLWGLDNVETIWHDRLHEDSFFKLERVDVSGCPNLSKIFPSTMLTRIQSLEGLFLEESCLLEEVFQNDETTKPNISQGGETTEDDKITFPQLRHLQLKYLSNLKRFCSGSCVVFPALTQLQIHNCKQIETFMDPIEDMDSNDMQPLFNEKVEIPNLKELELGALDDIKTIWGSRRILEDAFSTLERLEIWNCPNLSRIVPSVMFGRIQSAEDEIVFSKFKTLELRRLPSLVHFYLGNCILKFPLLEQVTVKECNNMKAFCGGITITPKLKTLSLTNDEMDFEGNQDMDLNDLQPLFNEKVEFRNLKKLALDNLDKIKIVWDSRIHEDLFSTLEELTILNCANLLTIFPLVMFGRIRSNGYRTITETVASESAEDEIVFSKLKILELTKLPSLVNFCPHNCILTFPVFEVTVTESFNLKAFCGGIRITAKLEEKEEMDFEGNEEMKNLVKIMKEARRLPNVYATSSLEHLFEAGIVTGPGNKCEISTCGDDKQDRRVETCGDAVECSQEVAEMNDKATESAEEAESSEEGSNGIFERIIEPRKEIHHTYDKAMEPNDTEAINYSREEGYKVDDELKKEGKFCEANVEPREEIITCEEVAEARNEAETLIKHLLRAYLVKETQGSPAPIPDNVDVTCPSSQTHPALATCTGATDNEFEGLEVAQHLVPLLEKAREKHGDFHVNPLIKSKTMRIAAMESVGQVLHILQTETPRAIDAEEIQIMEDVLHDLSLMSFRIEWLRPLIDRARKCLFCLEKEAKIDEMEVQLQVLKRELETEKVLIDLDRPLLDI